MLQFWNILIALTLLILPKNTFHKPTGAPYHCYAAEGTLDVDDMICSGMTNINSRQIHGATMLHLAVANGHTELVQALVDKGADVHIPAIQGTTPLHMAANNGHQNIMNILIKAGAWSDLCARDMHGLRPLDYAKPAVVEVLTAAFDLHRLELADFQPGFFFGKKKKREEEK